MLKKYKNKIIISSLVIIGIILIIVGTSTGKSKTDKSTFDAKLYTNELENKIEKFLKDVEGIRNVNIIISLDTSTEHVYAQNQSTFDYLIVSSSKEESAVTVTEIYPKVRGIAIACTNGDSPEVQREITDIISCYLGISSNRIKIVAFG